MNNKPKLDSTDTLDDLKQEVKVKSWRIPLPDFHFDHQPYNHSHDHRDFFGRERETKTFLKMLQNSRMNSGSYLVTGYRGAGKTSFVKRVMDDFSNGVADLSNYPNYNSFFGKPFFQNIYLKMYQFLQKIKSNLIVKIFNAISGFIYLLLVILFLFIFPYMGIYFDLVLVTLIIVIIKFKQHGWAAVYPLQWFRWLFKPTVQVHINLGHNLNNQRNVIFGLVNLLKEEYRSQINRTLLHKLSISAFVLFFSVLITIISFKLTSNITTDAEHKTEQHSSTSDTHKTALTLHQFLENRIHSFIFHDPHPQKPDKPQSHDESYLLQPLIKILGIKTTEQRSLKSEQNHSDTHTKEEQHHESSKPLNELCFPQLSYAHNLPDIHVEKYYIGGLPVAKGYHEVEEVSLFREVFLKTPYCALYKASVDLYRFTYQNMSHSSSPIKQRLAGILASLYTPYNYFSHVPTHKRGQESTAPRPYHIIHFLLVLLLILFIRRRLGGPTQILWRLENLCDRIEATEILDAGDNISIPFFSRKRHIQRHRLDDRQTESLLLQILQDSATQNWLIKPRIVFIFDELDKIHPKQKDDEPLNSIELNFSESVRQRKYEVERLLGSFKNLISVAPCYFIFIAGREMMDANLADQSEIRFLYASLFDKVFYIPSFLTDESDENGDDISSMVEQYVCRRLMRPQDALLIYKQCLNNKNLEIPDYGQWSLAVYNHYLQNNLIDSEQRQRLMFFLQDFVYFLTYRSAGDAKKLDLQFEEFVIPKHSLSRSEMGRSELQDELNIYQEDDKAFILFFDKKDQYRVQLIAHLFTIFHGTYSRMIRQYGDKLSVSVFSILDYVCKFHSMAFSKRDFERMADALDIHRAPTLPQVIDMVMNHILLPYTRQIQNGFYSFRFVRYIQREIRYISQFSESDMSAFNFSLDESNQIKAHFQQMLTEQTTLYQKERDCFKQNEKYMGNYVLPNLHLLIGSIHDQDDDYESAAIAYRTAIEYLQQPVLQCLEAVEGINKTDVDKANQIVKNNLSALILYVRANLKLGLLQERRLIYDTSHALYNRLCDVLERIFVRAQYVVTDPEQLLTLSQAFVSSAFLHAKTDSQSTVAVHIFNKIIGVINYNNALYNYNLHLRLADMYILRSEFKQAEAIYKSLCPIAKKNTNYSLRGRIWDGLATCKMANFFYAEISNSAQLVEIKTDYLKAADAYKAAGLGSEEQTVLWKLSYALIMGALPYCKQYDSKIMDLFESGAANINQQMQDITGRTFADAYTIHRQRLKKIGVKDNNLHQMASAPLLHSQTLLQNYACAINGLSANININIANLAAFPMHSRVLGLYLKGLYFYKQAEKNKKQEGLFKAFYLLIQALEESLDYECGMDLLIPPLGMTRYYIWRIVAILGKDKLEQSFGQESYFNADRQRYFDVDYCRRKTQVQLTELLSRHRAAKVSHQQYDDYVRNRFYLYDAFSDPYSQGLWAVEYGFVPFAEQALKILQIQAKKVALKTKA